MDRRTKKTKKAIQDAYFSLLTEKKTAHITIAEIAKTADIDRKTFYLHYGSTEDIIREFSEEKVKEWMDLLKKDGFFEQPFDTYRLFRSLNDLIMRDKEFYERLIVTSAFYFVWSDMQRVLVRTIKEVYTEIVDVSSEELDVYARFYVSGVLSTYVAWLRGEIPFDIERLGEIAADMTYFGAEKIVPDLARMG